MPTSVLTSVLKSVLTSRGIIVVAFVVVAFVVVVFVVAVAAWAADRAAKAKQEAFAPLGRLIRRVVDPSPQCSFAQCIECHGGATLRRTALGVPTCCVKYDGDKCGVCEYVDARGKARIQVSDSCPAAVRKMYGA